MLEGTAMSTPQFHPSSDHEDIGGEEIERGRGRQRERIMQGKRGGGREGKR